MKSHLLVAAMSQALSDACASTSHTSAPGIGAPCNGTLLDIDGQGDGGKERPSNP